MPDDKGPPIKAKDIDLLATQLYLDHNLDYEGTPGARGTAYDPRFPQGHERPEPNWDYVPKFDRQVRPNTSLEEEEIAFRDWFKKNEDAARADARDQAFALLKEYISRR